MKQYDIDKPKLIEGLRDLYAQNVEFISMVKHSETKKYSDTSIGKFKNLTAQLHTYIQRVENGAECTKSLAHWCSIFADILCNDKG